MEPRKFKQLIEQAASLSGRQRADLAERLSSSLLQEKTAALIEAAAPRRACPRCRSARLHRHGHAHGLQRYRCVDCARTFNALTGTPLARLRHRDDRSAGDATPAAVWFAYTPDRKGIHPQAHLAKFKVKGVLQAE